MRLQEIAKSASDNLQKLTDEELEGLHSVLLMILDDVIAICEKENLHFMLIGGSAIGALRHKGFIPWDDDIDLAMPREDFEKLHQIVSTEYSEKYSMLHPQEKNNYGRVIPKIRLRGTEYRTILERDLTDCGIFIDIYTIENVFDNKLFMYFQGIVSMFLGLALSCKRIYNGRKEFKKLDGGLVFYIQCFLGFCFSFATIEQWARWRDYWHSCCKNNHSELISIPADEKHFFGGLQKRSAFLNYHEVSFENRTAYVPGNFDQYLRYNYGDYMQLPPPEKRERNSYLSYNLGRYRFLDEK